MTKNVLTTIAAVLLLLYAFANFGAGFGQFSKAKMVSGTSSFAAGLGEMAGDTQNAQMVKKQGAATSGVLYLIALFILTTAVLDIVGAIGMFSGQSWAVGLVTVACICGVLVEFQDIAEDGFGVGKLIFLVINGLALIAVHTAKNITQDMEAA